MHLILYIYCLAGIVDLRGDRLLLEGTARFLSGGNVHANFPPSFPTFTHLMNIIHIFPKTAGIVDLRGDRLLLEGTARFLSGGWKRARQLLSFSAMK